MPKKLQPNPSPNLRNIAEKAGVHYGTVSRALRHDPSIPAATQKRIARIARQMGYKPNPLVSALMTQVHASRKVSYVGNIAFFFDSKRLMKEQFHLSEGYKILCRRSQELGFNLEIFFMDDYANQGAKLFKTLKNRGIHGIITQLFFPCRQLFEFNWDQFACATLGENHSSEFVDDAQSLHLPDWIPTVRSNIFSNMNLIFHKLKALGYQRPGLALRPFINELTENANSAPFRYLTQEHRLKPAQNIYIGDETDPAFLSWIEKSKFDILISHEETYFQTARSKEPTLDFINYDWKGGTESGIDPHRERMAAKVVDIVVAQLHRNERGEPPVPYNVLIDGTWQGGNTTRNPI
jgi:LacI family transcriptional regulator